MSKHIAAGIHPFWFWNTPLTPELIQDQIADMAQAGVKGVFIHPRQGMDVPYLSPRFFELIKVAIDACVANNMQPHLYDEFPYPAGIAGGLVTMGRPEYQATALQHVAKEVSGPKINIQFQEAAVLSCHLIPIENAEPQWQSARDVTNLIGVAYTNESHFKGGLSNYTEQRYFAHDPVPVLEIEVGPGDYLISAAIQVHVNCHKYWNHYVDVCNPAAMRTFMAYTQDRYQEHLGKAYLQHVVGWFVDEIHPSWSRFIPERYEQEYGVPMQSAFLALQHSSHPDHQQESERLRALQYDLFCESFEKPVSNWCREHDILYIVEKPQLRIEQLSFADVPGCDAGHVRAGKRHDLLRANLRYNARATASAAQIYGKQAALCEGFHSLGWSATLEDLRYLSDHLILHGIDRITPHAFFASSHGLRKHDAPPSFFRDQAYWPLFHYFSERLARIHAYTGQIKHAPDAIIIDPNYAAKDAKAAAYEDFLHKITASNCEYLIVDSSWFLDQDVSCGDVSINEQRIRQVITIAENQSEDLRQQLARFQEGGGSIVHRAIPVSGQAHVSVLGATHAEDLHQARFITKHGFALLAINISSEVLSVRIPEGYQIHSLEEQAGAPLPLSHQDVYQIDPLASFICVPAAHKKAQAKQTAQRVLNLDGPWKIERDRSNLLRLADWSLCIEQNKQQLGSGYVQPSSIASHIAELEIPLHRDQQQRFGQTPQVLAASCEAKYTHLVHIEEEIQELILLWEADAFRGQQWALCVNGHLCSQADIISSDRFGKGTSAIPISRYVHSGENVIELRISCERDDEGLLAPFYVSGEFAVGARQDVLRPWNSDAVYQLEADINNLDAWGCAYYDGVLCYSGAIDFGDLSGCDEVEIDCRVLVGEAFEVQINDGAWMPVLWAPRRIKLARSVFKNAVNICRIKRYASLGRRYDGEAFNFQTHKRRARKTILKV